MHPDVDRAPQAAVQTSGLRYVAFSYFWVNTEDEVSIICQGCEVMVTRNLAAALKYRHTDNIRIIWANAICINQQNPVEKERQV